MNWIEITGAITGLVYVILEIRQKRAMWILGALSALMYIIVFFDSSLYAAAVLQFYYVVVSVYGWRKWGRSSLDAAGDMADKITVKLPLKRALYSLAAAAFGFVIVHLILDNFSEDPYPGADAFVAVASMLATWWVSGKHIENWIVWIIANIAAAILFFWQGLYATAILYVVYAIAAMAGYMHWRKFPVVLK